MSYYYQNEFLNDVLGKGMCVENIFKEKKTNVIAGVDKIRDSIYTILSTRIGERVFLPEFGSKLHLVLFEQNSVVSKGLIDLYIREALETWEKRIDVVEIIVHNENQDNVVPVEIYYKVRNTELYDTYIYPFNVSDNGEIETYSLG